ncbi:hypothetical protein ACFVRU_12840 [Streptomyces sp. NPDC057927]
MPETTPNAKGPARVQLNPERVAPVLTPTGQVKSEGLGTLTLAYRDGVPTLVVKSGKAAPARLLFLNEDDTVIGLYEALPPEEASAGINAVYGGISWVDHTVEQFWYPSDGYVVHP